MLDGETLCLSFDHGANVSTWLRRESSQHPLTRWIYWAGRRPCALSSLNGTVTVMLLASRGTSRPFIPDLTQLTNFELLGVAVTSTLARRSGALRSSL